jgi:tRNA modification GTPase
LNQIGHEAMVSVAILTPPGRGAIATVAVWGSGTAAIVGKLFSSHSGRVLTNAEIGQILLGRWRPSGEELVVTRRAEDEIELHCHGGQAAVSAIVGSLSEQGCEQVPWRDWAHRLAASNIAAEAVEALAKATTLRGAAILLDQYQGALAEELESCAKLIEAADEASVGMARERLLRLVERFDIGRHLVEPFQVVIAGKPNVGKSSLINALAGYQRSIVFDQPGTTRDVVTVRTAIDGWPVELSDTAGLRASDDALESAGVQMSLERMAAADLVLLVFDASQPWQQADDELAAEWPDAVVVHNKADLAPPSAKARPGMVTSAVCGEGIEALLRVVAKRLVPAPPSSGAPVLFSSSQQQAIRNALAMLSKDHRAAAPLLRGYFFGLADKGSSGQGCLE